MKIRKVIRVVVFAFLAVAISVTGAWLICYHIESTKQSAKFADLAQGTVVKKTAVSMSPSNESESDRKEQEVSEAPSASAPAHDIRALQTKNPDCIGWVSVPGTTIDYPVMQTPSEPEYYLSHNFEKEYSDYGVPFLDAGCEADGGNLILYSHNRFDGSMFTPLIYFPDPNVRAEHPIICLEIGGDLREYSIFAAFSVDALSSKVYRYTTVKNSDTKEAFLQTIQQECPDEIETSAYQSCDFITLSTCDVSRSNGRIVVIGARQTPPLSEKD